MNFSESLYGYHRLNLESPVYYIDVSNLSRNEVEKVLNGTRYQLHRKRMIVGSPVSWLRVWSKPRYPTIMNQV